MFRLCLFLCLYASSAFAALAVPCPPDFVFEQERMQCAKEGIYILSCYEGLDGIELYDYAGSLIWKKFFENKILSWQIRDDALLLFAKARNGSKTQLLCLDRHTGSLAWQSSQ